MRKRFISILLDFGKLLQISQRTLHNSIFIMDAFMEKETFIDPRTIDIELIVVGTLLIGAKSGELDENIPFISKLQKYTGVRSSASEIKYMEVTIAESNGWNLQHVNFFTYIEYYLSAGVISSEDKISKPILEILSKYGIEDTVRLLVKEEASYQRDTFIASTYELDTDCQKEEKFLKCKEINSVLRNDLIKTFEFYVKDLCNMLVEGMILSE